MINKFDFTNGEWNLSQEEDQKIINTYFKICNKNKKTIAIIPFHIQEIEIARNARLISYAPEMLMALIELTGEKCQYCSEELFKYSIKCEDINCQNCRYIKLIEKATGKKWGETI